MGMKLVSQVMSKWAPHVPDPAFRILLRMAFSALDEANPTTPASTYTAGREPLIGVMDEGGNRNSNALDQSITRAIRKLIQIGAIERFNKAAPGRRQTYRLTLEGPIRTGTNRRETMERVSPGDSNGYHPVIGTGITPRSEWVSPGDTPRRTEEEERSKERRGVKAAPELTTARATRKAKDEFVEKKCDDPQCEMGYRYDPSKPPGHRNIRCEICRPENVIPFPPEIKKKSRNSFRADVKKV